MTALQGPQAAASSLDSAGSGDNGKANAMMPDLDVSAPRALGIAVYPPGASFGPRILRDFEFVWMLEGDAQYERDGAVTDAPQGSLVLCRPGATDSFTWDRHRRTRHAFFHFTVHHTPPHWPDPELWPLVRLPEGEDILRPLFRHLLSRGGVGNPEQARLTVALGLTAFVGGSLAAGELARLPWPEAVERAWSFLHAQLEAQPGRGITLADMAEAACVTPAHLCRAFKAATGRSPAATVRLARLDRAVTLLCRSNYSVGEVGALCGFASPYHFSRCFKEVFGQAPLAVRQAVEGGGVPPLPRSLRVTR